MNILSGSWPRCRRCQPSLSARLPRSKDSSDGSAPFHLSCSPRLHLATTTSVTRCRTLRSPPRSFDWDRVSHAHAGGTEWPKRDRDGSTKPQLNQADTATKVAAPVQRRRWVLARSFPQTKERVR